jgi:choline-sulfatase
MPPDSPFAMAVGYFTAHTGFAPCPLLEELYQKYLKRDLPVEPFTPADFDALPEHTQRLHLLMRNGAEVFNPDFHRHQMALYLARLEYADRQLGRLLEALDASGRAGETIVAVTGDHGENMGRHGLWGKMNFYEEAQRVPLSFRVPGLAPRRIEQPVSLVDCLATFADFAGVDVPTPTDGNSLRSLMGGQEAESPDAEVFSEYHGYLSPGAVYMLLRGSHKYVCHEREMDELYDLASDPGETRNLIADPDYAPLLVQMRSRLAAHVDRPAVAEAIRRHNQQRDMVSRCLNANPAFIEQTRDRARQLRDGLNEPWWDGGKYIGQWDPAAKQA